MNNSTVSATALATIFTAVVAVAGVRFERPADEKPPARTGLPGGSEREAKGSPPVPSDPLASSLAKIDRTLRKEPAYKSGAPRYCLLVLGPEAKTRVWLVLDGDVLYVDRNGDGDLTAAGERVPLGEVAKGPDSPYAEIREFSAGDLSEGPGGPVHTKLTVAHAVPNPRFVPAEGHDLVDRQVKALLDKNPGVTVAIIAIQLGGRLRQAAAPAFADKPRDAPVVHLNGPLAMGLMTKWLYGWPVLARGEDASELTAAVGTPGLGEASFAVLAYDDVPEGAHPVAAFRFANRAPGKSPIALQVPLKRRC